MGRNILRDFSIILFAVCIGAQSQELGVDEILTSTVDSGVQDIILPMCRHFLDYNQTRLPNSFGHSTQVEIYRHIEHFWAFMDYGCSNNFRVFICSLYLPRYDPVSMTTAGPCKETCNKARGRCRRTMKQAGSRWPRNFRCKNYPSKNRADCVGPVRESGETLQHTYCETNTVPLCQNLPYMFGSLPNLFLQRSVTEISTEMQFYEALVNSGCSEHLRFFLCGTYMPFCVHNESPFSMPCRELCEQVQSDCSAIYDLLYHGLPWPNKLQCHRFRSTEDAGACVMPGDK